MKNCPTSFVVREMQTKTAVRYHFTPTGMWRQTIASIKEDAKMLKLSHVAGGNIKWCGSFGKHSSTQKGVQSVFTAAIFLIAKRWNKPKSLLTNECIN